MKYLQLLLLFFAAHLIAWEPLSKEDQRAINEKIETNFEKWKLTGITRHSINEIIGKAESWNSASSIDPNLVRIRIINQKVYYLPGALFNKEHNILRLIKELAELQPNLNVDFIYYNGDGLTKRVTNLDLNNPPPILAGNTVEGITDYVVLFADWLTTNNYDHLQGISLSLGFNHPDYSWSTVSRQVEDALSQYPWSIRENKLFWRGRLTDSREYYYDNWHTFPRGRLKFLSMSYPDLFDVQITGGWDFNGERIPEWLAHPSSYVPTSGHLKYKYQIVIDGITCQYPGFAWRLLSNSTVLKVSSKNKQWFYDFLTAWKHYVPVEEDLSDLVDILCLLRNNDALAENIARNGRIFAQQYLT